MTLHQRIAAARRQLEEAGLATDTAAIDAEVLARHLLGWDRAQLLSRHRDAPPAGFEQRYQALIARRARREPVALITGTREFWGRDFAVTGDTLVPRPETELIVEEALQLLPQGPSTVIDVGTGSGCLAVTIAAERRRATIVATDISRAALRVAARRAGDARPPDCFQSSLRARERCGNSAARRRRLRTGHGLVRRRRRDVGDRSPARDPAASACPWRRLHC
jgi:release factor glutamine methyltransferase